MENATFMRCLHPVQGFTPRAGAYAACLYYVAPTGFCSPPYGLSKHPLDVFFVLRFAIKTATGSFFTCIMPPLRGSDWN